MYWVKVVFKMLPFIHAILNPFIYFAMSKNFRKMSVLKLKNLSGVSECQVLSRPIQHQHSSIALRGNTNAMTTTETAVESFRMEGKVPSKEATDLSSQGMLTHLRRQKYHIVFSRRKIFLSSVPLIIEGLFEHTHCLSWVLILIFLSYLQSGTTEIQGQRTLQGDQKSCLGSE